MAHLKLKALITGFVHDGTCCLCKEDIKYQQIFVFKMESWLLCRPTQFTIQTFTSEEHMSRNMGAERFDFETMPFYFRDL
jgi:hypothetical protein